MRERIAVIMGPTASGKTALSIELAKRLNGEIISADAFQVYRGLDIGTAKVTAAEMQGVPHHLLDIKEPTEGYTAAEFCARARECIRALTARGKLPIIAGGTGLYVQALLEGYEFPEAGPLQEGYRRWEAVYAEEGLDGLVRHMRERSPEYFATRPVPDRQRLIRALALLDSGADYRAGKSGKPVYRAKVIALAPPTEILKERIEQRVQAMLAAGLEDEARRLWSLPQAAELQATKGIGYREWAAYFAGEATREETAAEIIKATRRFAKRQRTWLRRMPYVHYLDPTRYNDPAALTEAATAYILGKGDVNDGK